MSYERIVFAPFLSDHRIREALAVQGTEGWYKVVLCARIYPSSTERLIGFYICFNFLLTQQRALRVPSYDAFRCCRSVWNCTPRASMVPILESIVDKFWVGVTQLYEKLQHKIRIVSWFSRQRTKRLQWRKDTVVAQKFYHGSIWSTSAIRARSEVSLS